MELYTDKLFVGKIGKIKRNENNKKIIEPTNEYIIFEKNNNIGIDVLTNNRFVFKDKIAKCIEKDDIAIIDFKKLSLFLPDSTLEVVNDYDILEVFNRVNNSVIYDNVENQNFSNISVFQNDARSENNKILHI